MSPEFWEFLDTVAKLSLSAGIAGYVTYRITALRHRQTIEEVAIRRRLELLEEITTGVAQYSNALAKYGTLTQSIVDVVYSDPNQLTEPPEEWLTEHDKLRKQLGDNSELERPEGLLYLLSADLQLPKLLYEYYRCAEEVVNYCQEYPQDIDEPALKQKIDAFKRKATQLVAELGKLYRNPS